MPASQVPQDHANHRSFRPLDRIQCDLSQPYRCELPTPIRQQKESSAFAEDVVLSGSGQEGSLQSLGNDCSGAKKLDYLKRWNADSNIGNDIDRTYKLKRGEFSPNYGGDRGRGSRSPGVSREASVLRESSQAPVAAGDEADAAAGGNKARIVNRSPNVKTRQSWREEPGKRDMDLLGRNPYQNVNSPSFKFSEDAQHGRRASGSGSGSGNSSLGNSLSVSAWQGRSTRTGSCTDSMLALCEFQNEVGGSVSTSASVAVLRPPASEARAKATPPPKQRSAWGESSTPVSSPQLGTRSSSRLAGRSTRSAGGLQDFWN